MIYSTLKGAIFATLLVATADALQLPSLPNKPTSRRQAAAFLAAGLSAPAFHTCSPFCGCGHVCSDACGCGGGGLANMLGVAPAAAAPIKFAGGLVDCVTTNPESYKVAAEIPGARLIEGTFKPGSVDMPHSHPAHNLYFVTDAELSIADPANSEFKTIKVPKGAAPVFPAGTHVVKNVGSKEVKVLFVEPVKGFKNPKLPAFKGPFETDPSFYAKLSEGPDFVTGVLSMPPGAEDQTHKHKDHLIYVLAGDEVTIYPGGDKSSPVTVPIAPGAGLPAPVSEPLFAEHSLKNTGKKDLKLLFFEKLV